MARVGTVRIGISGWTYAPWRGVFYPKGLPQKRELEYAASQFSSLEINGTFYGMQRPDAFADWADRAPDELRVRGEGTALHHPHTTAARCRNTPGKLHCLRPAAARLETGADPMAVSAELPLRRREDRGISEDCCRTIPARPRSLGRKHDHRLKAPAWLKVDAERKMRHAFEIRNETFRSSAFVELLREYDVALVCADTVEWPRLMDLTSDFVYCRLHGSEELYASGYDDKALDEWAARVATWAKGGEPAEPSASMARGASADGTYSYTSTTTPRCARRSTQRL